MFVPFYKRAHFPFPHIPASFHWGAVQTLVFIAFALFPSFSAIAESGNAGEELASGFSMEKVSVESRFSMDRGNLEKTEFGGKTFLSGDIFARHFRKETQLLAHRYDGEDSFSKEWRADFFYEMFRRKQWFFSFGSFIEGDGKNSLSLRYGLGAGVSRDIEKLPFSMKISPGLDIFYERESRKSEPAENRAAFRFAVLIERTKGNLKPSANSLFVVPADERDDWRSESRFSLQYPLKKFGGADLSITFNAGLKIQNKPPADKKRTDFSSDIGLKLSFERKLEEKTASGRRVSAGELAAVD